MRSPKHVPCSTCRCLLFGCSATELQPTEDLPSVAAGSSRVVLRESSDHLLDLSEDDGEERQDLSPEENARLAQRAQNSLGAP